MIGRFFFLFALAGAALAGFGFGTGFLPRNELKLDKEFPLVEFKSFAIVLYAQNDADWCERSLRSIFEQDYESFRLLFVDDGSFDDTFERVQNFIVENQQEHRTILIRNDSPIGFAPSLDRAAQHCLDRELILPLSAKDWLAGPSTLLFWNRAFQNPDISVAFGAAILYPSYEFLKPLKDNPSHCFYGSLFKQLSGSSDYLLRVRKIDRGQVKHVSDPVLFLNESKSID